MKIGVQNEHKQAALKTLSTELWNSLSQSFFGVMVLVGMIIFFTEVCMMLCVWIFDETV